MRPHANTDCGFVRDNVQGMRLFAVDESDDDAHMETSVCSPPRQSRQDTRARLFECEGDNVNKETSKRTPTRSATTRRSAASHRKRFTTRARSSQASAEEHMSDVSEDEGSILRPLNFNTSPQSSSHRRKRPGDSVGLPAGREDMMMEESDDDIFSSPHQQSPSTPAAYRTLDGRTVTSKNPFSPFTPNTSMDDSTGGFAPSLQSAPSFPVNLGNRSFDGSIDSEASGISAAATLMAPTHGGAVKIHLQQREGKSFGPRRDGFPAREGQYSFTGSPIEEIEINQQGAVVGMGSKARRKGFTDSASTAIEQGKVALFVDTHHANSRHKAKPKDDISPTDVMSFPTPPTPVKAARPPTHKYTPLKAAPPHTPMVERRTLARRPVSRGSHDEDDDGDAMMDMGASGPPKSRFREDFDIIGQLGNGSFGTVYKCLSRLDGCMYAIKAAKRKFKGMADRDRMLKEVYALAALSDEADTAAFHIVRYHQAWMEESRLYIQTELCSTTLQAEIQRGMPTEKRRFKILREILLALDLLRRHHMVHLDIKPENIFVKNDQFKLGDFGLVTKTSNGGDVEEGDSRYMSMELLSGDHQDLTKSDIFSLGATMYEICLGRPLPLDGQEWQDLRAGKLQPLQSTPYEMEVIIRQMMHPDPAKRPTASELLKRRPLLSEDQKQLLAEKNKVLEANMALALQTKQMKKLTPPPPRGGLIRANTWNGSF